MMNQIMKIRAMPATQPTTIPAIAPKLRLLLEEAPITFWVDAVFDDVDIGIVVEVVEVVAHSVVVATYQKFSRQ